MARKKKPPKTKPNTFFFKPDWHAGDRAAQGTGRYAVPQGFRTLAFGGQAAVPHCQPPNKQKKQTKETKGKNLGGDGTGDLRLVFEAGLFLLADFRLGGLLSAAGSLQAGAAGETVRRCKQTDSRRTHHLVRCQGARLCLLVY
jgi:hypothetical protein